MSTEIKNFHEFLQPIIGAKSKILNYSSTFIVPPGENYGGEILAVDVNIQENGELITKKFVAKLKPNNEMLCIMFNIQFTFKREMLIYVDVFPTLNMFQKEFNISKNKILDLFPICYGARLNVLPDSDNLTNDALILFENLKTQGYVMENRMIGLDLEQASTFLKDLARYHALPIALKILKPDEHKKIENLKPHSFGDSFSNEMKIQFLKDLADIINSIEDCKKYANKIVNLVDKGFKFEERFLTPQDPFATLVHNDLWVNNFLVHQNPIKIKLYDLQLASYGSLAHDLIFFLFSSVQQDIFDTYYDTLIKLYYDSFIECLKEFNINTDLFSWQSFLDEINIIGPYQISHIVIMMRPIFMEKNKLNNNAEMDEKELGSLHALDSRYKVKLRKNILAFAYLNWI